MKCIEDEIPFELPDGWAWARLGNIGEWKAGATPNRKCLEYYNGDIPWVKTGDLNDDYIKEIPETITKKALKETSVSIIPKDTVLIAMYGATIGKLGITTCDVTTNQACCACCNLKGVNKKFLFYFLMQHKSNFISMGFGGAQPNISKEKIVQVIIPIPPIEEQNKITAKLTELFTFVKKIESDKSTLQSTIQQTKSKILDLAIRGKLVPQDPNDEPASVLLERIRAEKEELIKQGKIKRDKKESVIFKGDDNSYYEKMSTGEVKCIDDELPFVLPEGWEWARLKSICEPISDGTHQTPKYTDEGYIFLSSKNVTSGYIDWQNVMYISESLHNKLYERIAPQKNDILLAKNGTTGVAALVDKDYIFDIYVTLALIRTIGYQVYPKYILCVFASNTTQYYFKKSLKGIGVPNLHLEQIRETLVPVPPKNEQVKIYEAVENLNRFIETVEASLN